MSERDQSDFEPLFRAFNIEDKIRYGTFNELIDRIATEEYKMKENTLSLFKKDKKIKMKNKRNKKPILIIDEVDTFFHEKFYGRTLTLVTKL